MAELVDFHTHTNKSDGDYAPPELLARAREQGVSVISITDHDTVDAYDASLFDEADSLEIRLVPGIELSSIDEPSRQRVHVLGLFIDPYDHELQELCRRLREERVSVATVVGDKLKEYGIALRAQQLIDSGEIITKAHIARDVIDNVANQEVLKKYHHRIPLQGEFIEHWLIEGCPAYVPKIQQLFTHQAVEAIHEAGGVAACAHPSFNVLKGYELTDMFALIKRNKFDAVEAINIQYDKDNNDQRFDMVEEFSRFAQENDLLITGGSDFHSDNEALWGAHSDLGLTNELYKVAMNLVSMLEEHANLYKTSPN